MTQAVRILGRRDVCTQALLGCTGPQDVLGRRRAWVCRFRVVDCRVLAYTIAAFAARHWRMSKSHWKQPTSPYTKAPRRPRTSGGPVCPRRVLVCTSCRPCVVYTRWAGSVWGVRENWYERRAGRLLRELQGRVWSPGGPGWVHFWAVFRPDLAPRPV